MSDLSTLTVPQLKDRLREVGLPVSGTKTLLIDRLMNGKNKDKNDGKTGASRSLLTKRKLLLKRRRNDPIEHVEVGAEPIIREKKAERRDERHVPLRQESMMEMESMIDISPEETWDGEDELEIFMRVGEKVLNERGILVDGVLGGARKATASAITVQRMSNNAAKLGDGGEDTKKKIEAMLVERQKYRGQRNYARADGIKDDLRVDFGVEIQDHAGIWISETLGLEGSLNIASMPNLKAKATIEMKCKLQKHQVEDMLHERIQFKRRRAFHEADEIRDYLTENGIMLFDRINEWAAFDGSMEGVQTPEDFFNSENMDVCQTIDPVTEDITVRKREKTFDV